MWTKLVSDIAFTPAVKETQRQRGSKRVYEKTEQHGRWEKEVDEMLATFIVQRDSIYLGTASADAHPYTYISSSVCFKPLKTQGRCLGEKLPVNDHLSSKGFPERCLGHNDLETGAKGN